MAAKILDIIDGSDLVQTETLLSKTRIAYVTGTTGTNAEREYDALAVSGMPALGDALGSTGALANCVVIRRTAAPYARQPNTIEVRLEYSTETTALADPTDASVPTYESGAVLEQFQTNVDVDGSLVTVQYAHPELGTQTTGAFVGVFRPNRTEVMERIESLIEPSLLQNAYVGKTNSVAWLDGAIGEWLCMAIQCRATDSGATWLVRYEFARRVGGWNPTAVYIDPLTGQPPSDLVEDVGYKSVDSYEQADFHDLVLGVV